MSGPPRLCEATLERLPPDVHRPGYDRHALKRGVVHLGVGAFHRAHQAAVFDDLIRGGDLRWGITAASLRSAAVRDALAPQDGLYTLVERDGDASQRRVIGAMGTVLVAPQNPQALVEALAAAETHLVTLTVTEKGYRLDPASGALDLSDSEIAADLLEPERPRTVLGFLTAALALRRTRGVGPLTVLSCDNLPSNGVRLRQAVLTFAAARDPALRDWIEGNAAFPSTMVDRIVPAATAEDIEALAAHTGVLDRAMVKTEPFRQWVIEDRFAGPRPDFEAAGVVVTRSVTPWETAKLRLLNGAHSAMAYLGGLGGSLFVHTFIADPLRAAFIERLWDETAATLDPPPDLDISAYRRALLARFANPALEHRLQQIAMDGSQKLPQRLVAPITERLQRGLPVSALALAVAGWMKWQGGEDDAGRPFAVEDPLGAETSRRLVGQSAPDARVGALLSMAAIFPPGLSANAGFRETLSNALDSLDRHGALATIERFVRA